MSAAVRNQSLLGGDIGGQGCNPPERHLRLAEHRQAGRHLIDGAFGIQQHQDGAANHGTVDPHPLLHRQEESDHDEEDCTARRVRDPEPPHRHDLEAGYPVGRARKQQPVDAGRGALGSVAVPSPHR